MVVLVSSNLILVSSYFGLNVILHANSNKACFIQFLKRFVA